jgi:hypothetical protein
MATFGFPVGLVCAERHSCPAGIGPVGADRAHCSLEAVRSAALRAARQGRRLGGARRDGAGGSRSGLAGGAWTTACRYRLYKDSVLMRLVSRGLPRAATTYRAAAQQNILAAHHPIECWTPRTTSGTGQWGRGVRGMKQAVAREVEELVHAAFEKSWRFVSTDPVLAHGKPEELRDRLSKRLQRLAQNGERDVWRLANGAISELRRELTAA